MRLLIELKITESKLKLYKDQVVSVLLSCNLNRKDLKIAQIIVTNDTTISNVDLNLKRHKETNVQSLPGDTLKTIAAVPYPYQHSAVNTVRSL